MSVVISSASTAPASVITIAAGSSAATIQAAINSAATGTHIVLQQGTYTFNKTVVLNKDGITLEGQGNVTIIADKALAGAPALQIGSALFRETETNATHLTEGVNLGATYLHLTSSTGLKVGDVLWIERPNDAALFTEIGDTQWQQDKPLRTAMVTVTAVNGNTVLLDRPLPFAFDAATTMVAVAQVVEDVTVRNLTFKGAYGTADPGNFNNINKAEDGGMMVLVNSSVRTVIEHVDIVNPGSNGLVLGRSIDAVVDDVTVTGAQNKGDGGNGYGFWIRDVYDSTFTHLQAVDTRHAVLFASYTSAANNTIEVDFTNRDINFHGGLDHGNTVIVHHSIRTTAEQSYMASVSFFNSGTSYGAPTDANANVIKFENVVATVRADMVVAVDTGAHISTLSGNDSVQGGAGNDWVDMGTGSDLVLASAGEDTINGGQGVDRLVFGLHSSQVLVTTIGGQSVVLSALGHTFISGIEEFQFIDGVKSATSQQLTVVSAPAAAARSTPASVDVFSDSMADASVQDVRMTGRADLDFIGNANGNRIIGNAGSNIIFGEAGNDRLHGYGGNDILNGGAGSDVLGGGLGSDTLNGGTGNNTLVGGKGSDVFIASDGINTVRDFSIAQDDTLVFFGFAEADLADSLTHWLDGSASSSDDFTISTQTRSGVSYLTLTSDLGDSLIMAHVDATDLRDYLLA
jgi:Ca2+-binding RTX toxin-like protein